MKILGKSLLASLALATVSIGAAQPAQAGTDVFFRGQQPGR